MTLSIKEAIEKLKRVEPKTLIRGLGGLDSYRGYYEHLAFEPDNSIKFPKEIINELEKAIGETFTGYKGGEFIMSEDTLLFVSKYGESSGYNLTDIKEDGSYTIEVESGC